MSMAPDNGGAGSNLPLRPALRSEVDEYASPKSGPAKGEALFCGVAFFFPPGP